MRLKEHFPSITQRAELSVFSFSCDEMIRKIAIQRTRVPCARFLIPLYNKILTESKRKLNK